MKGYLCLDPAYCVSVMGVAVVEDLQCLLPTHLLTQYYSTASNNKCKQVQENSVRQTIRQTVSE